MDIDQQTNAALLNYAERQTKALENINFILMALFVLMLVAGGVLVIAALSA